MVCKLCPTRKHCWDKGSCETCEFGKAFINLDKKIKQLKEKNKKLEQEKSEAINRLDTLLDPKF
jgi:hypothetical protein